MKRGIILALVCSLLAACSPVAVTPTPTATSAPSPPPSPSPTPNLPPESLQLALPALEQMGYGLGQGDGGWELTNPDGQVILSAMDSLTITTYGQNGELTISPEQAFNITKTIGLGMENLLTLSNAEGEITDTYLERGGYWAPIAEQYNNFEELEQCPRVEFTSLWDGQLAQSDSINMEPFPEGTIAPDGFYYVVWKGSEVYWILLQDSVEGKPDISANSRSTNYHRKYINCRLSTTPSGQEVFIVGEQILMPDKKTSRFQYYVYSLDWKEGIRYGSGIYDLLHSVLQEYTEAPPSGYKTQAMRPQIFIEPYDPDFPQDRLNLDLTGEQSPAVELYNLSQNNPSSVFSRIIEIARTSQAEITGNGASLGIWATEEELSESQFQAYDVSWGSPVPDFFYNQ